MLDRLRLSYKRRGRLLWYNACVVNGFAHFPSSQLYNNGCRIAECIQPAGPG